MTQSLHLKLCLPSLIAALLIFTMGCTAHRVPVCTSEFYADIPNFEGRYSITITDEDYNTLRAETQWRRISKGIYAGSNVNGSRSSSEGESMAYTCQFDNEFYLEQLKADGRWSDTYSISKIVRIANGSYDVILLTADKKTLEEKGIPFTIVESDQNLRHYIKKFFVKGPSDPPNGKNKIMLIDNAKISSREFVQLLTPLSIKMTFFREF